MSGTRRAWRVARRVALAVGGAVVALVGWGVLIEPRLIGVERAEIALAGLPAAWEGHQLALFSDLQVGMWLANTGTARRIVQRLLDAPPAAVLIAGDFLYHADDDLDAHVAEAVAIVRPLAATGIPTYAVLGNHDYSLDEPGDRKESAMAAQLRRALVAAGVRVLQNEAVALPLRSPSSGAGDSALYLVGIGANWAGEDDPAAALAAVPRGAPYVPFMHNPVSFQRMAPGTAPAAFAGHTHGGQVRIPLTPDWSWLTLVRGEPTHAAGWTNAGYGAAGNRLYVTRGIGFSDLPIRINCPPELTLVTLRRAVGAGGPVGERR